MNRINLDLESITPSLAKDQHQKKNHISRNASKSNEKINKMKCMLLDNKISSLFVLINCKFRFSVVHGNKTLLL